MLKKRIEIIVARAAPIRPFELSKNQIFCIGINNELRITLIIVARTIFRRLSFDFPIMETK